VHYRTRTRISLVGGTITNTIQSPRRKKKLCDTSSEQKRWKSLDTWLSWSPCDTGIARTIDEEPISLFSFSTFPPSRHALCELNNNPCSQSRSTPKRCGARAPPIRLLVGRDRKKNPRIPANFNRGATGIGTLPHNVKLPLCYYGMLFIIALLQIWSPRILLS